MAQVFPTSLAKIGLKTVKLFNNIKVQSQRTISIPQHQAVLLNDANRFDLWATDLGLFAPDDGSLDFRLRRAEGTADMVREFLTDFNISLEKVLEYYNSTGDVLTQDDNIECLSDELQKCSHHDIRSDTTSNLRTDIDLLFKEITYSVDLLFTFSIVHNPLNADDNFADERDPITTNLALNHPGAKDIQNSGIRLIGLCLLCQQISPWSLKRIKWAAGASEALPKPEKCNSHYRSFIELQNSSKSCLLCWVICKSLSQADTRPLRQEAPVFLALRQRLDVDLAIIVPELTEILVICDERPAVLYAFAEEGSEAALSDAVAGRPPCNPDSIEGFETVSTWLQDCIYKHPGCRIGKLRQQPTNLSQLEFVKLPPRLLDVGIFDSSSIRLFESTNIEGQYVALSHRWPTDISKHFMTTKSSIEQRKTRIYFEDLPESFQDAVKITRKLGLRYLWIDSLCITQDDPEDWMRQSVLMGQIYYNATITVMAATKPINHEASNQKHSCEGFLQRQPSPVVPVVKMPYYSQDWKLNGCWYIRDQKGLSQYHYGSLDLLTRGWVMQEEMLSRRKIIYAPEMFMWQCKSTQIQEGHRKLIRPNNYAKELEQDDMPQVLYRTEDATFIDHWLAIAEDYSKRNLTYESDKLPALSGLASYFAERQGQEYYAGIFSGSIPEGLLWSPSTPGCLSRPTKYMAPSWSWLSLNGSISMKAPTKPIGYDPSEIHDNLDNDYKQVPLQNIHFQLFPEAEQNPYGRLQGGKSNLLAG